MSALAKEIRASVWNVLSRVSKANWPDQKVPDFARGRFTPPQETEKFPVLMVSTGTEDGEVISGNAGPPVIRSTVRVDVMVVVSSQHESQLMDALDDYDEAVRSALLSDEDFTREYEGFKEISSSMDYSPEGAPLFGSVTVVFQVQSASRYEIIPQSTLEGATINVDALDPYDPSLVTTNSGPDGRNEGRVDIEFQ